VGLNRVLNIGASALQAFGIGIHVASNNIANADTEHYSRQRAELMEALPPERVRGGYLGRGVVVESIISLRAENLIRDYQDQWSHVVDHQTRRPLLGAIEGILNPDEDFGLTAIMEKFWDSWEDLANTPEGEAQRVSLVSSGTSLASFLRNVRADLNALSVDLDTNIKTGIDQINQLSSSIADINLQIKHAESTGEQAGSLRDQRDAYVKELSALVGNSYYEDTDGTLAIHLANGKPLVQGSQYFTLENDGDEVTWSGDGSIVTESLTGGKMGAWAEIREVVIPQFQTNLDTLAEGVIWEVNKIHSQGVGLSTFTSLTSSYIVSDPDAALRSVDSGLHFWDQIEAEDGYFKVFTYDSEGTPTAHRIDITSQTTLNDLTGQLNAITGLSAEVSSGRLTLSADTDCSFTFGEVNSNVLAALGLNTFFDGSNSENVDVNDVVSSNHALIAAGRLAGVGEDPPPDAKIGEINPGDARNALAIAELRQTRVDLDLSTHTRNQTPVTQSVSTTLGEFLGTIIGQIGALANDNTVKEDFHTMMANQLDELVKEHGGVNLDEELIDLLKYQRAYQSAAKLITAADELLQTLIGL